MPAKKKKKADDATPPKGQGRSTKETKQKGATSARKSPGSKPTGQVGRRKDSLSSKQGPQGQRQPPAPTPVMLLTPPPPEGRVTRIDRNQAAALAHINPADKLFDGATDFYLVEWTGTMPFGLMIDGREIKDLDIESEQAIDTEDVPIGRCRLLDGDDEDAAAAFQPGAVVIFRGIVWCN